jgi:hypothetical protein
VTRRSVDPATGFVTLELVGETPEKHAACLGATGTAPAVPPLPALGDLDAVVGANSAIVSGLSDLAAGSGNFVPLDFTVSASLFFVLQPGATRVLQGQGALAVPTGPGTAEVEIEWRESGGSWTATSGASESYDVLVPVMATHSVTVTNSGTAALTFEARGTVVRSNTDSGPLTAGQSVLVA